MVKLTYFDLRYLAEGSRLILQYAGQDFEDNRLNNDQWASLKPSECSGTQTPT